MTEEVGGAVYVFEAKVEGVKRGMTLIKSEFAEVQKEANRVAKNGAAAMATFGDSMKLLAGASADPSKLAASWAKATGQLASEMGRFSEAAKAQGIGFAEMTQRLIYFKNEGFRAKRGVGDLYQALRQYDVEAATMIRLTTTQAQREAVLSAALARTKDATVRAKIEAAAFGLTMQDTAGKASVFSGAIGRMGKAMAALLTIGAIERVFSSIVDGVRSVADIDSLAKNIGMTTDELQRLQYALAATGISGDQSAQGLQTFAERLSDARRGEGELADLFAANNVAFKDREGRLLTINEMLLRFSDLVRSAATDEDALNIATMGFGREGGRKFIEALRVGSEALVDLGNEAEKTGNIIAQSQIEAADKIERRYNSLIESLNKKWQWFVVAITSPPPGNLNIWDREFFQKFEEFERRQKALDNSPVSAPGKLDFGKYYTKMPIKPGRKDDAGSKLQKEIDDYIKSLQEEADALRLEVQMFGQSAAAKARAAAIAKLPIGASEAQKQKALELVAVISQETEALEKLNKVQEDAKERLDAINEAETFFSGQIQDVFFSVIDQSQSVSEAFEAMAKRMIDAMLQAVIFGEGPFAALLGSVSQTGGAGGLLGGLLGLLKPPSLYAAGGRSLGGPAIVGEEGPELVDLPAGAQVTSHRRSMTRMQEMLATTRQPLLPSMPSVNLSPTVNIRTINNAGADVSTRAVPNGSGGFDIETMIEAKINDHLAGGRADRVMDARFGLKRRVAGWG